MKKLFLVTMAVAALVALLAGCAIPGASPAASTGSGPSDQPGSDLRTGTVEIRVTDAPRSDNVSAIWVTVSEVQIHKTGSGNETQEDDGAWITANITAAQFELLALKSSQGLWKWIGGANMTAGKYTQIRMTVDSVKVTVNGENKTAEVPSGKIKFVQPFDVIAGQTTVLLFDFDADKMVNITGNGKILVKPVVKLTVEKPSPRPTESRTPESLKITTHSLPNGTANVSYSAPLAATGGTLPYTWALASGPLPGGLTIIPATGLISGKPTAAGNFAFTVSVSDNSTPTTKTDTQELTIRIKQN